MPKTKEYLKSKGRNGDTELAHVNPREKRALKAMGGSGTTNPDTGLKEYFDPAADFADFDEGASSFGDVGGYYGGYDDPGWGGAGATDFDLGAVSDESFDFDASTSGWDEFKADPAGKALSLYTKQSLPYQAAKFLGPKVNAFFEETLGLGKNQISDEQAYAMDIANALGGTIGGVIDPSTGEVGGTPDTWAGPSVPAGDVAGADQPPAGEQDPIAQLAAALIRPGYTRANEGVIFMEDGTPQDPAAALQERATALMNPAYT